MIFVSCFGKDYLLLHIEWPFGQFGNKSNECNSSERVWFISNCHKGHSICIIIERVYDLYIEFYPCNSYPNCTVTIRVWHNVYFIAFSYTRGPVHLYPYWMAFMTIRNKSNSFDIYPNCPKGHSICYKSYLSLLTNIVLCCHQYDLRLSIL